MANKRLTPSPGGATAVQQAPANSEAVLNDALARLAEYENIERNYRQTLENLYLHQEELRTQNDELRHAQASLENARRRHQDLFDFSPVAQFLVSPNGMILKTNRVASELLGLGCNELYNFHMPNLAGNSSHRVGILSFLSDVAANKTPHPIIVNLLRRDGRTVRVQLHGSRSGAQQETSILLSAVDNSGYDELAQERMLRIQAEQLGEALLSHCGRCVFVTDAAWRIVKINHEFAASFGFPPKEIIGGKLELFAFWDSEDEDYWQVWQTLRNSGEWHGETPIRDSQGQISRATLKINAIRDPQSRITGYLGVLSP